MAGHSVLPRPLFEPTDLLGPDPLPTPPQSTDADSKDGEDVVMEGQCTRPERMKIDSPPPDFDEEPSDLEDDVMAMMENEQKRGPSFVSTGLLDFDGPRQMATASSIPTKIGFGTFPPLHHMTIV